MLSVLPDDDDEEPEGAAEPVEGPETPCPLVGEAVGYGGAEALDAGIVIVLKVDDPTTEEALEADSVAEEAALEAVLESGWAVYCPSLPPTIGAAEACAEVAAGSWYMPSLPPGAIDAAPPLPLPLLLPETLLPSAYVI